MPTKLLDTTFLVHQWAGRADARAYLEDHEDTCEFATTTVNVKEIAVGRYLQGAFDRSEILGQFEWVRILPFETEDAFAAGRLEARLHEDDDVNRDKVNALAGDVLIAAVAIRLDAPVVTKNVDDFELLDGLSVESY